MREEDAAIVPRLHWIIDIRKTVAVQSKEELLNTLRDDEKRLQELADLVAPRLRERVEAVLKNVQSRIAVLELRQGLPSAEHAAGVRRENRTPIEIAVRISGIDALGRLFDQKATTVDVTTTGARVRDVHVPLHRGCIVKVQREKAGNPARFRVMWVADSEGREIGLQLMDVGRQIWGVALERQMGDFLTQRRKGDEL
jgi:hypothetical protein